jgi:hypothetical protein
LEPFPLLDIDDKDLKLEEFVQRENSGIIQMAFEHCVGKVVYKIRFFMILVGLAFFAFTIWCSTKLQSTNKPESILKDTDPTQKGINWSQFELWKKTKIDINICWGLSSQLYLDPAIT